MKQKAFTVDFTRDRRILWDDSSSEWQSSPKTEGDFQRLYRVQTGYYRDFESAENAVRCLHALGFNSFVV